MDARGIPLILLASQPQLAFSWMIDLSNSTFTFRLLNNAGRVARWKMVWIDWDKKRLVILRTASMMNPLIKDGHMRFTFSNPMNPQDPVSLLMIEPIS
jgi:hypothetical protein